MMQFILSNGKQTRWEKDNPPVPCKQLVKVEGEILLERTQRLFGGIVITKDKRIIRFSNMYQDIGESKGICADLLEVVKRFGTISYTILLGDVFYTQGLADKIINCNEDMMFFMNDMDILALKWKVNKTDLIKEKLEGAGKGKLWHLYRLINGISLNKHEIRDYSTMCGDRSRDFDNWLQYKNYVKGEALRGKH